MRPKQRFRFVFFRYLLPKKIITVLAVTFFLWVAFSYISYNIINYNKYSSTITLAVANKPTGTISATANLSVNHHLAQLFVAVANSQTIADQVITALDLPYTSYELNRKIKITRPPKTILISITAYDHDPARAKLIASTYANAAQSKLNQPLSISRMLTVKPASEPVADYTSALKWFFSILIGAVFAAAFYFATTLLHGTVRSPRDFEAYQKSLIGCIPTLKRTGIFSSLRSRKRYGE